MNVLALCSGVGGLDLGLKLAVSDARTVCYVESDAYAAATLVARMEDEALDEAPVWSDLRTFDGTSWRGRVDIATAGFPCQPVSVAGKRKAQDDDRWLWPDVARILGEVGPRYVFLENVPGILSAGAGDVLGDLAGLGFDAEWDVFRAADIGAPHRRARWFCLAYAADLRRDGPPTQRRGAGEGVDKRRLREPERSGATMANTEGGDGSLQLSELRQDEAVPESGGASAVVERSGRAFPPGPSDDAGWQEWLTRHPNTEPAIRRGADGLASRVDRLRACGNGVVPLAAAHAWRTLEARLMAAPGAKVAA